MSQFDTLDFHNPLENTASILRGLASEIHELREGLLSEQHIRANEINALRKAFESEKGELPDRVGELTKEIADWRKTHTHRFEKVEQRLSEMDMEVGGRLDRIDSKLDAEIEDRLAVCQDLIKKVNADGHQWKGRCGIIEKEISDLKKALEQSCLVHAQRHDQCKMDVDKIASLLRENTLAKETFEHYNTRPSPRRAMTPTTASPGSRSYTPTHMATIHVSSPSHAFAPTSLHDGESGGSGKMKLRLSGMR